MRGTAIIWALLSMGHVALAQAAPLLHDLFQDHAVFQRGQPIRVWGKAAANESLQVTFAGANVSARADASGAWNATLPAMSAGGPHTLIVTTGAGATQRAEDVLVGDVWLCSGQSNMVLQVHRALDSRAEIAGSANDSIRMLTVGLVSSVTPLSTFSTPVQWQKAAPSTVPEFSAACFYFAREIQKTARVPMGLVNASWGGSRIEAWMSGQALRDAGADPATLEVLGRYASDPTDAQGRWAAIWETWWRNRTSTAAGSEPWSVSPAVRNQKWQAAPRELDVWEKWQVPALAQYNGMLWYRVSVKLTARQAAQPAVLSLGRIDEVDQTWVNGRPVGNSSGADIERAYSLPPKLLQAGENVIVVNALDTYGSGGINGPTAGRALRFADGSSLPLDGTWEYQIAPANLSPYPRAPWDSTGGMTILHNAMIAPMGAYGFRGVLWYQGESNTEDAPRYQTLLSGLMADWRRQFGAQLPFLVVQLANYGPPSGVPRESGWAEVREAQRLAVAKDAHAGLAVAVDIGDRYDIHPANKQELARRLARAARHVVYQEAIAPSGPVAASAHRSADKVVVTFEDVEKNLLAYSASRPVGFELCGAGRGSCRFVDALVKGASVELDASGIAPTRVRYCWADSPVCTLYDESGLPAGPFELALKKEH